MITIELNGESTEIADDTSLAQLLEQLDLTGKRLAVELNQQIISRNHFAEQRLKPGDRVEIVQAIGGGSH